MIISEDTRLEVAPSVHTAVVGSEAILLESKSGMYYGLDQLGVVIWTRLAEGTELIEIHRDVASRFEVGSERLWADLVSFLDRLSSFGLIQLKP